jgi:hypothetical protein
MAPSCERATFSQSDWSGQIFSTLGRSDRKVGDEFTVPTAPLNRGYTGTKSGIDSIKIAISK